MTLNEKLSMKNLVMKNFVLKREDYEKLCALKSRFNLPLWLLTLEIFRRGIEDVTEKGIIKENILQLNALSTDMVFCRPFSKHQDINGDNNDI